MGWVRVDDAFYDHDKFQSAGPLGVAQWIAGLAWSNRNLKDGFIPHSAARRLLDWNGVAWRMWSGELVGGGEDAEADEVSKHLVDCGLWEAVEGGYRIHDYHDYQPSAERIRADREKNAARQASWRNRTSEVAAPGALNGHSHGDVPSNAVTNSGVTGAPNPNTQTQQEKEDQNISRAKRGTRVPEPFPVDDDMRQWAFSKGIAIDLDAETEQFVDHHRAKGTTAKDWTASWRTWMRNAQKWSRTTRRQPPTPSNIEQHAALWRQLENGYHPPEIA